MDLLTLMVMAQNTPRAAVRYTPPISVVKVGSTLECAACALAYIGDTSSMFRHLRDAGLACYSIAPPEMAGNCYQCKQPVEHEP